MATALVYNSIDAGKPMEEEMAQMLTLRATKHDNDF